MRSQRFREVRCSWKTYFIGLRWGLVASPTNLLRMLNFLSQEECHHSELSGLRTSASSEPLSLSSASFSPSSWPLPCYSVSSSLTCTSFLADLLAFSFFPYWYALLKLVLKHKSWRVLAEANKQYLAHFSQVGFPRSRFWVGDLCTGSLLGSALGFDMVSYRPGFLVLN